MVLPLGPSVSVGLLDVTYASGSFGGHGQMLVALLVLGWHCCLLQK